MKDWIKTGKEIVKVNAFDKWIKLELICVHKDWKGKRIGTMLLACTLAVASSYGEIHTVLHVAGGKNNVPAIKLYERFGFREMSNHFKVPNDNLYVLLDINQSLKNVHWRDLFSKSKAIVFESQSQNSEKT